jgi:hypothetical protein
MTSICRFSFTLATSSHRAVSTRATAGLRTGWTNQCPPRDQYGAAGDLMVPLRTPRRPLTCDFRCAPGRNRTCDSRFRNQMRALLLPAQIALTWLVARNFVLLSNPPLLYVSLPFAGPRRGRCGWRKSVTSRIGAYWRSLRARSLRKFGIWRHPSPAAALRPSQGQPLAP